MNIREKIQDQSDEQYHAMMRTNVDSCYFLSKALHQALLKGSQPCVVMVSSAAGLAADAPGCVAEPPYLHAPLLARALACTLIARHIDVLACPMPTDI